jgi:hypothetical protein
MPGNILNADIGFPRLEGQDTNQYLQQVQDYLFLLLENLRYTLNNLDSGNFNDAGLKEITNTITEPINARLEDDEGNISSLQLTTNGLSLRVGDLEGQTTVYVNSQGLIVENGSGAQVKIGNGAVAADFFYGQKYYDASGTNYLKLNDRTSAMSTLQFYDSALGEAILEVSCDLLNNNIVLFYACGENIGYFAPNSNTFYFNCDVYGAVARFG